MKNILLCLSVFFYFLNGYGQVNTEILQQEWKLLKKFSVPESVLYDAETGYAYVANINGKPTEKNGEGYISRLIGKNIQALKWAKGLNAPKGMGIYNNYLYVTDIDRVAKIDLKNGEIIEFYEASEAKFLNDITVDEKGNIYISDMLDKTLYILSNNKMEKWLQSEKLNSPNGLYAENGYLMVGLEDRIVKIDTKNQEITDFILNTGSIDGLEKDGHGYFIFSDWAGKVFRAKPGGEIELLLNTTDQKINAADIEYIKEKDMLLVPTFFDNSVVAYKIVKF